MCVRCNDRRVRTNQRRSKAFFGGGGHSTLQGWGPGGEGRGAGKGCMRGRGPRGPIALVARQHRQKNQGGLAPCCGKGGWGGEGSVAEGRGTVAPAHALLLLLMVREAEGTHPIIGSIVTCHLMQVAAVSIVSLCIQAHCWGWPPATCRRRPQAAPLRPVKGAAPHHACMQVHAHGW